MTDSPSIIRAEFDRLALLAGDEGWTQNNHYHDFLLRHVPSNCDKVLEIGCGTGEFSRRLAERSKHVLAIDLSPEMIRRARERSMNFKNIDFQVLDAVAQDFPDEEFDCIATIATMHHLPFQLMLSKMKRALKPNGVILILDLDEPEGVYGALTYVMAMPVSVGFRFLNRGHLRPPAAVRRAWAEHAKYDSYLKLSEVRAMCVGTLPKARVRKHLLWRYSVVWQKVVI
jgi:ubiquinone/menaquinone biosynthesis C-methylase UbiE